MKICRAKFWAATVSIILLLGIVVGCGMMDPRDRNNRLDPEAGPNFGGIIKLEANTVDTTIAGSTATKAKIVWRPIEHENLDYYEVYRHIAGEGSIETFYVIDSIGSDCFFYVDLSSEPDRATWYQLSAVFDGGEFVLYSLSVDATFH